MTIYRDPQPDFVINTEISIYETPAAVKPSTIRLLIQGRLKTDGNHNHIALTIDGPEGIYSAASFVMGDHKNHNSPICFLLGWNALSTGGNRMSGEFIVEGTLSKASNRLVWQGSTTFIYDSGDSMRFLSHGLYRGDGPFEGVNIAFDGGEPEIRELHVWST